MALFESGNPTLSQKIFSRSAADSTSELMTVRGTINKFGFLLLMVIGGAAFVWDKYYTQVLVSETTSSIMPYFWAGMIGGLVCAFTISFKPKWAPYLAPIYGILEGFLLGAISAIINDRLHDTYPGIVIQAVGLTFGVAIAMFLLYNFRVIKATERLRSIITTAVLGIFIFYAIDLILFYGFKIDIPYTDFGNNSAIGIGLSLFVIAIAALKLILDFDMIEKGADMGAPKFMEWYGAFGLLVTIVWLYFEILRLLSRFAGNKR